MRGSVRRSRRAWLERGGEPGSEGDTAKPHGPERENSAGRRQTGSPAERDCLLERLWHPEGWVRWQRQPPELQWSRGQCLLPALLPSCCPPTPAAAFQTPESGWNWGPRGGDDDRAVAPGPVPNNSQDLFNYGMEFVQVLLSPQPSPPTQRLPALSLKWMQRWGVVRPKKPAYRSRALNAQKTKGGKLREILFLPAAPTPQLCRRAPFQLWSCMLSLVRDPREQLGHSHEPL